MKKAVTTLIDYWLEIFPSETDPPPEKLKVTFSYFSRHLPVKKIKEAIELTSFKPRQNPFNYMCGILNNWVKGQSGNDYFWLHAQRFADFTKDMTNTEVGQLFLDICTAAENNDWEKLKQYDFVRQPQEGQPQ